MARAVECRCPYNRVRLLFKVIDPAEGRTTIEVACDACRSNYRKRGLITGPVLHTFSMKGEFLSTEVLIAPAAN